MTTNGGWMQCKWRLVSLTRLRLERGLDLINFVLKNSSRYRQTTMWLMVKLSSRSISRKVGELLKNVLKSVFFSDFAISRPSARDPMEVSWGYCFSPMCKCATKSIKRHSQHSFMCGKRKS